MHFETVMEDTKIVNGVKVYRIQATKNFETNHRNVKKGELGGYICDDTTLDDCAWVFGDAVVIDSSLDCESYIVGDYVYSGLELNETSIHGTGHYTNDCGYNFLENVKVIGHNYINGSKHSVVWGVDKNTNVVMISVGCQLHSLNDWKGAYEDIANDQDYESLVKEYLGYLKKIENSLKHSNEKILEKISSNISTMKVSVTEALKTETISLITSLQVSPVVSPVAQKSSGPQRDKFGRFAKKNP